MKGIIVLGCLASAAFVSSVAAQEEGADNRNPGEDVPRLVADIEVLEGAFPALALCHWSRDEVAFVYGDPYGLIRHIITVDGKLIENWRSFPLESAIREVLTADLEHDGYQEIIASTADSRVYIWSMRHYELLWDSTGEDLGNIQAIVTGNVDGDAADELITNDGHIIDALSLIIECSW
jgi:hypothetical protein